MLHHELREEVPELGRLRLVGGGVVLHCLRPPYVVDADDEGLHVGVGGDSAEVQSDQPERNQGEENDSDLEIRVHHQRGAVHFHELPLGAFQRFRTHVRDRRIH